MRPSLSQNAILRVVASLVAAHRAEWGSGRAWDCADWTAATSLGADDLGLDSLELLAASHIVSRFFRLHETGDDTQLLRDDTLGGWARLVADALERNPDGLMFATSGTTGTPKLCRQPMVTLYNEALFWSRLLAGRQRVIQTVAAHHIYGFLFTILLPDITEWPVLDARRMAPAALRQSLRPTDVLVGVPTGLSALLSGATDLPAGLRIISAGSGLPAATHTGLRCLGAADIIDIYGSSETAGIAARHDPTHPFTLLPRWRKGPTDDTIVDIASDTEFALPDRVTWDGQLRLRPVLRVDGAVQVAGMNVFPDQVAAKLRQHPMLADCTVTLDTSLPEPRLHAFVVPKAEGDDAAVIAACDHWSRRHFTAPERPVRFDVTGSLPQTGAQTTGAQAT